jgi:hypothetical protein
MCTGINVVIIDAKQLVEYSEVNTDFKNVPTQKLFEVLRAHFSGTKAVFQTPN